MILSLQTGHVSPQFHVYFDDMFEESTGVPLGKTRQDYMV